jgi:polysaccharide export outer membrane protein
MSAAFLLVALLQTPAAPTPAPTPNPVASASPAPTPTPAAGEAEAAASEYQVGPGDVLEITVFGNEDLSRIPTVQTDGSIALPLLGAVQVAGLTVGEVQRKVTSLLAKDYLVNPQVEVKVREYKSQFVSVLGEVNQPGRKPLRGPTRLIDALLDAGGFTQHASGEVLIARSEGSFESGRKTLTVRISSAKLTPQDEINLSLPLVNGDIITASPKYYVTVDGEVNHPGRYPVESDLTVTGAISLAGGLTRFGSDNTKLKRIDPATGKVTLLRVDLKDVRNGKQPDVPLQANDVITVSRRVF